MAPGDKIRVGAAVDVWAVGCIMYETTTGLFVPDNDGQRLGEAALRKEYPAKLDQLCQNFAAALGPRGGGDGGGSEGGRGGRGGGGGGGGGAGKRVKGGSKNKDGGGGGGKGGQVLGKSSRRSLVALLRAMLSADPRVRPSMAQVLQSAPFAAGGAGNGKGGKKGLVLGGAKKGPGRAGGARGAAGRHGGVGGGPRHR